MYYTDTFGTSRSGFLIQVVSEYRWSLTQISLYSDLSVVQLSELHAPFPTFPGSVVVKILSQSVFKRVYNVPGSLQIPISLIQTLLWALVFIN